MPGQKIRLLSSLFFAFCHLMAGGEERGDSLRWRDFDYIRHTDAWLESANAAGLTGFTSRKISEAGMYALFGKGKFVNYHGSDEFFDWGLQTESFYRLNSRLVFYGKVDYKLQKGKKMGGSAFICPYDQPFDLVEYADTNRGNKRLEQYCLAAAVGASLGEKWSVGGKIDYTVSDYAKHKDLRHRNRLLDLELTAGVKYACHPKVAFGGNYYYRRSIEGISFSQYGETDRIYVTLISFGSFWGRTDAFDNDGYTGKNSLTAMVNKYHGASFQLDFHFTSTIGFYNEFGWKKRDGYFGDKSSSALVFCEHSSDILEYRGQFRYRKSSSLYTIKLNLQREKLKNHENIYRYEMQPGGNNIYVYYGQNQTLNKESFQAELSCTAYLKIKDEVPVWVLAASGSYRSNDQLVSLYPFYRKQNIDQYTVELTGLRNFIKEKNKYTLSLNMQYASGDGNPFRDGLYASPSEEQASPKSIENALYKEYEFFTISRMHGDIAFCYSCFITPEISTYIRGNYAFTRAFKTHYLDGKSFGIFGLRMGCVF